MSPQDPQEKTGPSVEDRLNRLLAKLESKVENLQRELKDARDEADVRRRAWALPVLETEADWQKALPLPRLEMRLEPETPGNWHRAGWRYGLVYRDTPLLGSDRQVFSPFSQTGGAGYGASFEDLVRHSGGKLPQPFRDGVHIQVDAVALGLPAFITCPEKGLWEQVAPSEHAAGLAAKLVRKAT